MVKKREACEALKIEKEKKKMEHMKVQKYWKKEERNIAHTSMAINQKRENLDERSIKILGIGQYSTHLHILIKVYDLHLLGSGFWLSNICDVSMPLIHTYL